MLDAAAHDAQTYLEAKMNSLKDELTERGIEVVQGDIYAVRQLAVAHGRATARRHRAADRAQRRAVGSVRQVHVHLAASDVLPAECIFNVHREGA